MNSKELSGSPRVRFPRATRQKEHCHRHYMPWVVNGVHGSMAGAEEAIERLLNGFRGTKLRLNKCLEDVRTE